MPPKLSRLDSELVRRKIARSREQAQSMISEGRVTVGGFPARKASTSVTPDISIKVADSENDQWASRGAHKLIGALDGFSDVDLKGKKVLDAGASTGGFTDVVLHRGAKEVWAADVGYGQLIWRLQNDHRVKVLDRTNVRFLTPEMLGGHVDVMVGDLSFISLELVLPAITECVKQGGDLLPMVKPQFEVGKNRLGHGGVVRSPQLRAEVVEQIIHSAFKNGLSLRRIIASPLPGPSGNVEYFLHLVKDGGLTQPHDHEVTAMITTAIQEGPQ